MALRARYDHPGWESMFIEAEISAASAKVYLQTFSNEEIMRDSLHMLDHAKLKELSIRTMGNMLVILKLTKEPAISPAIHVNPPTAKLSQLNLQIYPQPSSITS